MSALKSDRQALPNSQSFILANLLSLRWKPYCKILLLPSFQWRSTLGSQPAEKPLLKLIAVTPQGSSNHFYHGPRQVGEVIAINLLQCLRYLHNGAKPILLLCNTQKEYPVSNWNTSALVQHPFVTSTTRRRTEHLFVRWHSWKFIRSVCSSEVSDGYLYGLSVLDVLTKTI